MPLLFSFGKEVFTMRLLRLEPVAALLGAAAVFGGMPGSGTGRFFPAGEHGLCCGGDAGALSHSCTWR